MYAARLLGCEGDGNAGVESGGGVIVVSAYMGGTRGSGVLASAGDVLEMSVVRGVGGVGDRIGFGLYQFWRNMGRVGSVFWLRWCGWFWGRVDGWLGPGSERVGWSYVCACCESGFSVLMAGPGICILC